MGKQTSIPTTKVSSKESLKQTEPYPKYFLSGSSRIFKREKTDDGGNEPKEYKFNECSEKSTFLNEFYHKEQA